MKREIETTKNKATGHVEEAFLRKNAIAMSPGIFSEHKKREHRFARRVIRQQIKNGQIE